MSIPGDAEPGAISGHHPASFGFSGAIPIKKRRFPVIRPPSPPPPPPEVKPSSCEDHDSKNEQESNVGDSDVSKTTDVVVENEGVPGNVEIVASEHEEVKPTVSLNPVAMEITVKQKDSDVEVPDSKGSQSADVKQEIFSGEIEDNRGLEVSNGMSFELSLGPKEPNVPALEHPKSEAICHKSDKSDPSLLSLGLCEVCTNRSNWDLNTTMDVWEGSTDGDAFGKIDSCHDEKSSLTTAETVSLGLDKGKNILDVNGSNSCQLGKNDVSLGLGLGMPHGELDARKERFSLSLSDSVVSSTVSPSLGLKQVQVSATNVNRTVKSEPVDENSRRDCSVGSSSSSNVGLLKISSVKTEFVNNDSLETVLPSSTSRGKLVNCSLSMKSEVVQEGNQKATTPQSAERLTQHQESCASSSSSSLPVTLLPQSSCHSRLPTCSELTTSGVLLNRLEHSFHNKELHDHNDKLGGPIASTVSTPVSEDNKQLRPCNLGKSSVVDPKSKLGRVDENTVELFKHGEEAANDEEKINIPAEIIEEESFESDFESHGNRAVDSSMDVGENLRVKEDEEYEDGEVREPLQHSARENPISVTLDKGVVFSEKKDVKESPVKEISSAEPTNVECGIGGVELGDGSTDMVVKETNLEENNSTISKVEASLNGDDVAKDCSNAGNKSRIINLSRASVLMSPCKTKSIPNKLLTPRSGKEKYSDLDGEIQLRGNRDEIFTGGSNKFAKDRGHDQPLRNSRPNFMLRKGSRISGRFGSLHSSEWDSDRDFASEASYGASDYRAVRRKHVSSISDVDFENGYGIQQDGATLGSNRRKAMNDEFSSLRRKSIRRLSPDNRDGPATRGIHIPRRFSRNMSPNRCNVESSSDVIGLRHGEKFIRHLPDDMINPVYNHPQDAYDEFDEQLIRGNRNFSSTMQRKGYPRIRSKSPLRSRTRSPGPWSSPRRRSPNGPQELPQHRSPALYRMGRLRSSPDRVCFRDEIGPRRRGSPSYVARHANDEHAHHPRSANSNRRGSPGRVFPRNARRTDALDSRETGEGDEYMNGPSLRPNKFHELHGDESIDERRKFVERGGPLRSFRPNYNGDGETFRFHPGDGPRNYRFCPDGDSEFVERSNNMRERELDGRMKHQSMGVSRRIRNIEEQQDGNYRPAERIWHDDGFVDGRGKRRRF